MKFLITENKLSNIFQTLIDSFINELKSLKESNWRNIPDEVSSDTWDDIDKIIEITISNINKEPNKWVSTGFIYEVTVDIVFDSVTRRINMDELLWDISYSLHSSTGLDVELIEGDVKNIYLD